MTSMRECESSPTILNTPAPYAHELSNTNESHDIWGRGMTSSTQFGHLGVLFLRGVLTFVGRGLAFDGYILSYFEGNIN